MRYIFVFTSNMCPNIYQQWYKNGAVYTACCVLYITYIHILLCQKAAPDDIPHTFYSLSVSF